MTEVIRLPYTPRPHFLEFHARSSRWAGLVCHRRMGKTVACVADLAAKAIRTKKPNARYAYICPFFRQAKDVAWTYLKDMTRDFASEIRESELRVKLPNGAWITLYGADNPDALRGLYLDGVILDEYGDCRPFLWAEVVLPTLADRKGWAVFIGTPKGKNHFYNVIQRSKEEAGWFHLTMRASQSGLLDQEELAEMRAQMTDDQYEQELECSFDAALQGTYYAELVNAADRDGRITTVPYDPEQPVDVATDLGFTDSTAIWFWQLRPDGIAMIDFYENASRPLDHYFDVLWEKPYEYDTIWLPHDARARTLQTGRSTVEQFIEAGFPIQVAPKLAVQHGIDAGREVLPRIHFDRERCGQGLEALKSYRRKWDELNKTFSNQPLHDWSSHPADAYRVMSLVTQERLPSTIPKKTNAEKLLDALKPQPIKLEELYEQRERDQRFSRSRLGRL